MKKYILFIIIVLVFIILIKKWHDGFLRTSFPSTPESSEESIINKTLINRFIASEKYVNINGEIFLIKDAWTTYLYKNQASKEINYNIYHFFLILESKKTGKINELENNLNIRDYIQYKKGSEDRIFGFQNLNLSIHFIKEKIDTLKVKFKNGKENKVIKFSKLE